MSDFEADIEGIRQGAAAVRGAASGLDDAAQAGASAQKMSERAFGLLCVMMVPPSNLAQTAAGGALRALASAVSATAESATAAADQYDEVDLGSSRVYTRLMRSL
ncbi:type VII secretion target [Microbacterium sp. Marseille-Q6965]|uniref:type VII secretion target n=1 Tax=Microbacterium sp. Marseille-Q6965 TaxID=2965072 RepID=UPI0021B71CEC|nr:type VII secretion target [Microbacterium sp. Marseille-Q6965]